MSGLNRNDLQAKTTSQLAALFNKTNLELKGQVQRTPERDAAMALLTMIRAEQARRSFSR